MAFDGDASVFEPPPCAVCLEPMLNHLGVLTGCGHVFHMQCIKPWHQRNKSCPECRKKNTPSPTALFFEVKETKLVVDDHQGDSLKFSPSRSSQGVATQGLSSPSHPMNEDARKKAMIVQKHLEHLLDEERKRRTSTAAALKNAQDIIKTRGEELRETSAALKVTKDKLYWASKEKIKADMTLADVQKERTRMRQVLSAHEYSKSLDLIKLIQTERKEHRKMTPSSSRGKQETSFQQSVIESQQLAMRLSKQEFDAVYRQNRDLDKKVKALEVSVRSLRHQYEHERDARRRQEKKMVVDGERRRAQRKRGRAGSSDSDSDDWEDMTRVVSNSVGSSAASVVPVASASVPAAPVAAAPVYRPPASINVRPSSVLQTARTSTTSSFRKKQAATVGTGAAMRTQGSFIRKGNNGMGGRHKVCGPALSEAKNKINLASTNLLDHFGRR